MQKVLVIDDDDALRDTVLVLLETEGFQVESAAEGHSGYQRALALRPDLVLVDLNLPGLDGFEICRKLRESGFTAPIIVVTGESEEMDTVRLLEHGADDYVVKPFRPRELVARIRAVLRRVPAGPAPAGGGILNLLRECPGCGACFDHSAVTCPRDGRVPVVTLPIDRTVDGKYRLDRLLGRGGMGAVYAAADTRLNRRVAVKLMLTDLFGHEKALRRFEREAQSAARLNHRNIIRIYDYGSVGRMGAYLVMELLEGKTWREELEESGRIPQEAAAGWVEQLLDGVNAAHAAGVIHRDLKPDNILITRADGRDVVKILDFGLARMKLLRLAAAENLTAAGMAMGTLGYMPPEQMRGRDAGERSDIYSLGVIVLEALTGAVPQDGLPGITRGISKMPGPISLELAEVLSRSMALEPEARYGSVEELRTDLMPLLRRLARAGA